MAKDYYKILGVEKNASEAEIKNAFRKKAHEHHPDKGGDEEKFKEVNEAYQVLKDPDGRRKYDQFGEAAFTGGNGGGFNWSDFQGGLNMDDLFGGFSDIFGFSNTRGGGRRQPQRGRDLELTLNLSFKESVFGLEKEISFSKQTVCDRCHGDGSEPGSKVENCPTCQGSGYVIGISRTILGNIQTKNTCPQCQGEGKMYSQKCFQCGGDGLVKKDIKVKVRIPAGISDGETIRLSGYGDDGYLGGPAGNLYLQIRVIPDKKFKRDGYDIRTDLKINIKQAILGDKVEVETVYGPVILKIPAGTQPGTVFKLRNKGFPKLNGFGQGEHFVTVKVEIPKNISRQDEKIIKELKL
ncbi:MAG: molecular chaperone DnaJ [Patescibacteria group bacterium]|jgi:molecular chaperone DnaJ